MAVNRVSVLIVCFGILTVCRTYCLPQTKHFQVNKYSAGSADLSLLLFNMGDYLGTDLFIKNYFDVAMKIHAICSDLSISKDDAKLYVYIYVKTCESPEGIDYFQQDCSTEISALKSLLGVGYEDTITFDEPVTPQMVLQLYQSFVNKSIKKIERDAQLEYGLERVISSELAGRLRLHIDPTFRMGYIETFKTQILPEIANYTEAKVNISNVNYQIKLAKKDRELDMLLSD